MLFSFYSPALSVVQDHNVENYGGVHGGIVTRERLNVYGGM